MFQLHIMSLTILYTGIYGFKSLIEKSKKLLKRDIHTPKGKS